MTVNINFAVHTGSGWSRVSSNGLTYDDLIFNCQLTETVNKLGLLNLSLAQADWFSDTYLTEGTMVALGVWNDSTNQFDSLTFEGVISAIDRRAFTSSDEHEVHLTVQHFLYTLNYKFKLFVYGYAEVEHWDKEKYLLKGKIIEDLISEATFYDETGSSATPYFYYVPDGTILPFYYNRDKNLYQALMDIVKRSTNIFFTDGVDIYFKPEPPLLFNANFEHDAIMQNYQIFQNNLTLNFDGGSTILDSNSFDLSGDEKLHYGYGFSLINRANRDVYLYGLAAYLSNSDGNVSISLNDINTYFNDFTERNSVGRGVPTSSPSLTYMDMQFYSGVFYYDTLTNSQEYMISFVSEFNDTGEMAVNYPAQFFGSTVLKVTDTTETYEWFADILGDACDFNEGDVEGFDEEGGLYEWSLNPITYDGQEVIKIHKGTSDKDGWTAYAYLDLSSYDIELGNNSNIQVNCRGHSSSGGNYLGIRVYYTDNSYSEKIDSLDDLYSTYTLTLTEGKIVKEIRLTVGRYSNLNVDGGERIYVNYIKLNSTTIRYIYRSNIAPCIWLGAPNQIRNYNPIYPTQGIFNTGGQVDYWLGIGYSETIDAKCLFPVGFANYYDSSEEWCYMYTREANGTTVGDNDYSYDDSIGSTRNNEGVYHHVIDNGDKVRIDVSLATNPQFIMDSETKDDTEIYFYFYFHRDNEVLRFGFRKVSSTQIDIIAYAYNGTTYEYTSTLSGNGLLATEWYATYDFSTGEMEIYYTYGGSDTLVLSQTFSPSLFNFSTDGRIGIMSFDFSSSECFGIKNVMLTYEPSSSISKSDTDLIDINVSTLEKISQIIVKASEENNLGQKPISKYPEEPLDNGGIIVYKEKNVSTEHEAWLAAKSIFESYKNKTIQLTTLFDCSVGQAIKLTDFNSFINDNYYVKSVTKDFINSEFKIILGTLFLDFLEKITNKKEEPQTQVVFYCTNIVFESTNSGGEGVVDTGQPGSGGHEFTRGVP